MSSCASPASWARPEAAGHAGLTATMATVLDEILARKRDEVERRKRSLPLAAVRDSAERQAAPRGFRNALMQRTEAGRAAVIAEIKKASPSKGVMRADFDPPAIATSYEAAGAACLSVLTDEHYFQGGDAHLQGRAGRGIPARAAQGFHRRRIPGLRGAGAGRRLHSADRERAGAGRNSARSRTSPPASGSMCCSKYTTAEELETALSLQPRLIGINNRNLKTFETSLATTFDLLDAIPDGVTVVTESGIRERSDVQAMLQRGVRAFLVGEAFMRAADPGTALRELFG